MPLALCSGVGIVWFTSHMKRSVVMCLCVSGGSVYITFALATSWSTGMQNHIQCQGFSPIPNLTLAYVVLQTNANFGGKKYFLFWQQQVKWWDCGWLLHLGKNTCCKEVRARQTFSREVNIALPKTLIRINLLLPVSNYMYIQLIGRE